MCPLAGRIFNTYKYIYVADHIVRYIFYILVHIVPNSTVHVELIIADFRVLYLVHIFLYTTITYCVISLSAASLL